MCSLELNDATISQSLLVYRDDLAWQLAALKTLASMPSLEDPYRILPHHSPIIQDQSKTPVPEAAQKASQNWPRASQTGQRPNSGARPDDTQSSERKAATPRPTEQAAPGAPQHKS